MPEVWMNHGGSSPRRRCMALIWMSRAYGRRWRRQSWTAARISRPNRAVPRVRGSELGDAVGPPRHDVMASRRKSRSA
jgi:hypothetical protein